MVNGVGQSKVCPARTFKQGIEKDVGLVKNGQSEKQASSGFESFIVDKKAWEEARQELYGFFTQVAGTDLWAHHVATEMVAGKLHCCDSTQAVIPSWTPPGEGKTTAATLQAHRSTLLRRRGHGMKDVAAGVHHGRWKTGDDRGRSCYVLAGCSSLPPTICSVDVVAARRRRRITELTRCAAVASRRGKDRWALPLLSPAQFAIAARQRECRHPTPLPCTVGEQGRGTPLPLRKVSLLHASRRWKENVEPAGNTRTHRVALISPEPFRLELQPPVAHASFHRHCCSVSKVTRKGGKGLLPCRRRKGMLRSPPPQPEEIVEDLPSGEEKRRDWCRRHTPLAPSPGNRGEEFRCCWSSDEMTAMAEPAAVAIWRTGRRLAVVAVDRRSAGRVYFTDASTPPQSSATAVVCLAGQGRRKGMLRSPPPQPEEIVEDLPSGEEKRRDWCRRHTPLAPSPGNRGEEFRCCWSSDEMTAMAEPAAVAIWRTSERASGRSIGYRR
nr:hypothetical protein Itr_chr12CG15080 [Ipomoea trifida]